MRLDKPVYCSVNFTGRYARGYHSSRQGASRRGNFPRLAHQLNFVARFEGDHCPIPKTSSIFRVVASLLSATCTGLSRPLAA